MSDAAATTASPADAAAAAASTTAAADQAAATATEGAENTDTGPDAGREPTAAQIAKWGTVEAAREIQRLSREDGDRRMQSKANAAAAAKQETLDAVAVALGIKTGKEPATLEGLTTQLTEASGTITETTGKLSATQKALAITQAAWAEGVNPEKLDYLEFKLGKDADFQKIDTTKPGYEGKVKAAIAAVIAADSTLKLAGQVQRSGAESFGGASGDDAITKAGFAAMSMAARTALKQSNPAAYARLVAEQ